MQAGIAPIYITWARWCVINLLLVALAGLIIRSKIIFPLAFIQQKNFLHGHSHFAFGGWVSASLMTAIISMLFPGGPDKKFSRLFYLQMLASYGMLLTFPVMGYKLTSIIFSTITIVVSWAFCWIVWKPLNKVPVTVSIWIRTALLCNVFSSFGTFVLAWLMTSGSHSQDLSIGSLYFFLHFQYNGWFFFSCAGLLFYWIHNSGTSIDSQAIRRTWQLLAIAVIPAFFLSTLWMRIPGWVLIIAIAAAVLQLIALVIFLSTLKKTKLLLAPLAKYCLVISLISVSLKFILQALSCIPQLSIYAFGYRSLVIAFLHLVLLGFVSLFILGYFVQAGFMSAINLKKGIYIFSAGIILNEMLLMFQGISAIAYVYIPFTNEALWGIAIVMITGIFLLIRKSA